MKSGLAYCGLRVAADISVAELPLGNPRESSSLRLSSRALVDGHIDWVHHWSGATEISLSLGCSDGAHVLRFDDGAVFEYVRATGTVYGPEPPLTPSVRHQLLDHVLPRVLDDLGHLMVHGSAIDAPNGAVIFIGDTGFGKSTLAASFESAGVDLLSDDCMRLTDTNETVLCIPTYRSLRLWPDSADAVMPTAPFEPMTEDSHKRHLDLPEGPPTGQSTVAAICVLAAPEAGDDVTFAPLAPTRAVSLLLAQCFRLDPTDAEATKRTFERCVDVVERVPVVQLGYPREYDRLSEVREAVLQRAASGDWPTASAS